MTHYPSTNSMQAKVNVRTDHIIHVARYGAFPEGMVSGSLRAYFYVHLVFSSEPWCFHDQSTVIPPNSHPNLTSSSSSFVLLLALHTVFFPLKRFIVGVQMASEVTANLSKASAPSTKSQWIEPALSSPWAAVPLDLHHTIIHSTIYVHRTTCFRFTMHRRQVVLVNLTFRP